MRAIRYFALVVIGIAAVLAVALGLFQTLLPEQADSVGLGTDYLLRDLNIQTAGLSNLLQIKPLVDIPLLVLCYGLVALALWSQQEFAVYWKNRHRFH